ncbi:MAG: hypothetical protein CMJ93_01830 [Planctomycetes bacterium]|nr:hypothetical protein [Planctomycetota bacterium]
MLKSERNFLHAANAITGISGIVYFAMLYFIEGSNEFSILNHPWQDAVRDWHIVLAPLLIFAVALILKGHILKKIRNNHRGRGRISGLLLCALFPVMAFSAYLLQVSANEITYKAFLYLHNTSSFLWVAIYLIHQARMMRQ